MKFKLLAGAIIAVMAGMAVWWWIAAGAQKAALEGWLAEQRARGWQAEAAEIAVNGFPNRLDATLRGLALANVQEGWAWEAERLAIRQVIYAPKFAIIHFPPESRLSVPGARARLTAERMEASLRVTDPALLAIQRFSFDARLVGLAADAGWTASAERLTAHLLEAPEAGPDNAYQFRIDGLNVRPPQFIRRLVDPAGTLPPAIETVIADGRVAFDAPLDRLAVEGAPPQPQAFSLRQALAKWGELELRLSGRIQPDAAGYAEGEFDVSARNWRRMIEAAVAAGAIPERFGDTLAQGLGFVAGLSGDPATLDVALTFSGGFTKIGPVPIGPAPRMVAR